MYFRRLHRLTISNSNPQPYTWKINKSTNTRMSHTTTIRREHLSRTLRPIACYMVHRERERRLSKAYVPGTGMVAAGQGKARWLTASLLSFQHQGDNTGLQVPWLRASLLNFQLQGYNAGLPVPLGHPHEHNRKA